MFSKLEDQRAGKSSLICLISGWGDASGYNNNSAGYESQHFCCVLIMCQILCNINVLLNFYREPLRCYYHLEFTNKETEICNFPKVLR